MKTVSNIDIEKQHTKMFWMDKRQLVVQIKKIKLKPLVVLLENCLSDVARKDQPGKKCKQNLPSVSAEQQLFSKCLQPTTNVVMEQFIDCNENDTMECTNYVLSSDTIDYDPQCINLDDSLLLDLPISNPSDIDQVPKTSMMGENYVLDWEKLAEPITLDIKTPLTSGNSSVDDLDLTPPSSILFEEGSSFLEDSLSLDIDRLTAVIGKDEEDKEEISIDRQHLEQKRVCKELCVEIECFEPTLCQLRVLYRQKTSSRTGTSSKLTDYSQQSLRPRSNIKQFVPFMFMKAKEKGKKRKRRTDKHSRSGTNKHSRTNKHSTPKTKQTLKVIQKKQLALALRQNKEAFKHRNKFVNALDSINRRICNQNAFWRMLPR